MRCTIVAFSSSKLDEFAEWYIDVCIGIAILERTVRVGNAIFREESNHSIQGDIHRPSRPLVGKELACIGQVKDCQG